ncbi:MAG: hypothetical protein ACWA47_08645 [Brevirhabdus sp.]
MSGTRNLAWSLAVGLGLSSGAVAGPDYSCVVNFGHRVSDWLPTAFTVTLDPLFGTATVVTSSRDNARPLSHSAQIVTDTKSRLEVYWSAQIADKPHNHSMDPRLKRVPFRFVYRKKTGKFRFSATLPTERFRNSGDVECKS